MKYIGNLDLLMKNDIEFPSQKIFRKNLSHVEVDLTSYLESKKYL